MEGRNTGGGGSRSHHGEGSPAPRPSPAVERGMTSPEGESDDSDISIVGETPGNGSSALDSLGNFSLNSLLGGSGGSSDIGGSDSPLGRGSPHHHHRASASSSSSSTSASSSQRAYPPSASYGSMASMTHHMMTSPYMTPPGWGFPVWNPAGMSVPMPPSGPSIQHSDRSPHHSTQHSRSQHHHSSSSSSRDGSKNDTLSLSDNGTRAKHAEDQLRESDSPGRGSRGSPSMHHSLPSATTAGMPRSWVCHTACPTRTRRTRTRTYPRVYPRHIPTVPVTPRRPCAVGTTRPFRPIPDRHSRALPISLPRLEEDGAASPPAQGTPWTIIKEIQTIEFIPYLSFCVTRYEPCHMEEENLMTRMIGKSIQAYV